MMKDPLKIPEDLLHLIEKRNTENDRRKAKISAINDPQDEDGQPTKERRKGNRRKEDS
jgi:hypothetical protein